jgi:NAD-dependent dihydropyrimidine dehydrogenase PreA subunit
MHRNKGYSLCGCLPKDCIHPSKKEPGFEVSEQLYIDPVECIDCGACVPARPVSAIYAADDLPDKWKHFAEINAKTLRALIMAFLLAGHLKNGG